jgi:hypothetical protein
MNPYIIGGVGLLIVVMGWQLKSSITRNGELTAKLEMQAGETLECVSANVTNATTITDLEGRMSTMVEERRIESERREQVLIDRSKELAAANIRAAELERIRDNEQAQNEDCADLTALSLDRFCPATAHQLRQRSIGEGSDGDPDS